MARGSPFRPGFRVILALLAPAALTILQAGAAEVACRESQDFVVEVDGEYPQDARFYLSDTHGKFLVDIPSRSESALLDLPAGRAVPVPRTSLRPEPIDGTVRVREPGLSDGRASKLAVEGQVMSFLIDTSKVRILKVSRRSPATAPPPAQAPSGGSTAARSCLRFESRPEPGVAGCTRFVYLVNTCDAYVVAQLGRTEHLFSGPLPQTFSVVVPSGAEHPLGCAWWSGAMAPTDHELLAAGFLDVGAGSPARGRHGSIRR